MVRFFSYFFAVMALLTLSLKSYGQDNKTVYSCDPEINEWVKANLDKIHKMSRTEWLLLDEMKGRAVFAAFTPQQQQDFWQTKIKEVLALDWKTEERTHIQKLGNFFKEHFFIFSNHSPESEKVLVDFCMKWASEAKEQLGWDDKIVYAIVMSGAKVLDTKGNLDPLPQRSK